MAVDTIINGEIKIHIIHTLYETFAQMMHINTNPLRNGSQHKFSKIMKNKIFNVKNYWYGKHHKDRLH